MMRSAILLSMLVCAACSSSSSGKSGTGGNGGHDAGTVGAVDSGGGQDAATGGSDDLSTSAANDLAAPAGSDLAAPVGGGDLAVVSDLAIGHDIAFASPPDLTAGSNNSCPCPAGSYCDLATNSCVAGCVSDSDCPSNDYCDTTQRTCAPGCRTDNDCASPADACQNHVCGNQCGTCDDGVACTADSCVRNVCQHKASGDGAACSLAQDPCSAGICAAGTCVTQPGTCHFIELEALESPPDGLGTPPAAEVDVYIGSEPTGACRSIPVGACTAKVCSGGPPSDTWVSGGTVQLVGALTPVSLTPNPTTDIYTNYSNATQPLFTASSQLTFTGSGATAPPFTLPLMAAPAAITPSFSPVPPTSNGVLNLYPKMQSETMTWSYNGFPINSAQVRLTLYAESATSSTQIDCFAAPSAGTLSVPMAAMQLLPANQTGSYWVVSVETHAIKSVGGYAIFAHSAIYSSPSDAFLGY